MPTGGPLGWAQAVPLASGQIASQSHLPFRFVLTFDRVETIMRHEAFPEATTSSRDGLVGCLLACLMFGSALAGIWFGIF